MNRGQLLSCFVGVLALWAPCLAQAEMRLLYPAPRYEADNLLAGPCGLGADMRGGNVTTLRSGALIDVRWLVTNPRPGHFRIGFDADGQDDLDPPPTAGVDGLGAKGTLIDGIVEDDTEVSVQVRLPNIQCENCTLQVIQVLYDRAPYELGGDDVIYACADVILSRSVPCPDDAGVDDDGNCVDPTGPLPGESGGPDGDDGEGDGNVGPSLGGTGGVPGGGSGTPGAARGDSKAICSLGTSESSLAGVSLLALGWVLARRRARSLLS